MSKIEGAIARRMLADQEIIGMFLILTAFKEN